MLAGAFATIVGAEGIETKPYENDTFRDDYSLDYFDEKFEEPEDKLEAMDYRYGNGTYELYVDAYSGEVAVLNVNTGEKLFTNPYNIASLKVSGKNKQPDRLEKSSGEGDLIMSQLVVEMKDIQTNDIYEMDSYKYAASRRQIKVKDIRGGLRVEYSIGIEETKLLVPERIPQEIFDEKIRPFIEKSDLTAREKNQFFGEYTLIDPDEFYGELGSPFRTAEIAKWGVRTNWEGNFYTLPQDPSAVTGATRRKIAQLITEYCPNFTFEDMDDIYLSMGYVTEDTINPVVKLALEYTIDAYGLSVRLPANGIRFDEKRYVMESLRILPYMGVGLTDNGYSFFPDGAGTLFSFRELMDQGNTVSLEAAIYGADYAYQKITGNYEEIVRYPVFGLYETQKNGQDRGFLAIVEEGESMMSLRNFSRTLSGENAGQLNGVSMIVQPRPKDSFQLTGSTAASSNWEVVSAKKFTGSFRVRYIMLTDADRHAGLLAASVPANQLYACSYVGMAKAYREYLEAKGVLSRLTAEQVDMENIPLYIETLGSMITTKKVLSIPINMMSALTSFADIMTIRGELAEQGITNLQFILNGYTKGGLSEPSVPYKLKWEGAVEDDADFEELLADAKDNKYGIFPNFDFAFAANDSWFDGLDLGDHAVKTVENRYTTKRLYSATKHATVSTFEIALSPAYFSHFYEKLLPQYEEYEPIGISVNSLGSYLNSDFDETEPYNREENKQFTIEALQAMKNTGMQVMTEAANAYTWQYVDHITDIALDSSRFKDAYATVPFLGMVLHGYVHLAGTPVNMEGNMEYAMLKSIESGAALQFIIAYDNTEFLKNDERLSENFSVQYQIWHDDIVSMYTELNAVLKNVQTSTIVDHQFISGYRVPDLDELERDAMAELEAMLKAEASRESVEKEAQRKSEFAARMAILKGTSMVLDSLKATGDGSIQQHMNAIQAKFDAQLVDDAHDKAQLIDILKSDKSDSQKEAAIIAFVEELYADIVLAMDLSNEVLKAGNEARSEKTKEVLMNSSFKQEVVDDLLAMLTEEFGNTLETLTADYAPAKVREAMLTGLETLVYAEIDKILEEAESELRMEAISVPEFSYEVKAEDSSNNTGNNGTAGTVNGDKNRYVSDANQIVRETYENGADFLLNFNDYAVNVTVSVNGEMKTYTIDAYGYVVLSSGTNS